MTSKSDKKKLFNGKIAKKSFFGAPDLGSRAVLGHVDYGGALEGIV
jgi:hypothetical protein